MIDRILVFLELVGIALAIIDFAGLREKLERWIDDVAEPKVDTLGRGSVINTRRLFLFSSSFLGDIAEASFGFFGFSFRIWWISNLLSWGIGWVTDQIHSDWLERTFQNLLDPFNNRWVGS